MNTITITRHRVYEDGSSTPIIFTFSANDVNIRYMSEDVTMLWDDITDPELLADAFADVPVRVFRIVMDTLAHCYDIQTNLKALL